ncbi:MAG TPA: hypothetical protein DD415_03950 [Clostridiales bacterium]|nr:hypothetical protein [Clostridiales bacterium]
MELYKIKIKSSGDGWTDNRTSIGKYYDDGVMRFKYEIDGDVCVLSVKDGVVTQTRKGDNEFAFVFERGKTTKCVFGSEGMRGEYAIHTDKLKIYRGDGVFRLTLGYCLGDGEEKIKLIFTAVKNITQEMK